MISKIRGGILSCIGLFVIHILRSIVMNPNLELDNFMIYLLIIQLGGLWFTISLWIVIKYDLVVINELVNLKKPLNWFIRSIAIYQGAAILYNFFQNRGFYAVILIAGLVLFVNYIIVLVRFYRIDKDDLEFVGDLHSYVISMILLAIVSGIINALSELIWHADYDFILYSLSAIPIVFLMRFLIREKNDIEKKQSQYSID
jgi:hypothetical protein